MFAFGNYHSYVLCEKAIGNGSNDNCESTKKVWLRELIIAPV